VLSCDKTFRHIGILDLMLKDISVSSYDEIFWFLIHHYSTLKKKLCMLNINLKKKSIKSFLIITRLFPESGSEKVEILGSVVRFFSASSHTIAPITHFLKILIILLIVELYYYHIIVYLFIYPILFDQILELIFALMSRICAVKTLVNLS
jgi:hypothetical protein